MIVLGINSVYHELAAALLIDGQIIAAVEEERFNRQKHGKAARVDNPHHLPTQSIEFCLKRGGVKPRDIDAVAYSFSSQLRRQRFCCDKLSQPGDWGDPEGERVFISCLEKVPNSVSSLLNEDVTSRFRWIPHHLAHAASAYYPSGATSAAILVADGIGEMTTTMMGAGEGSRIRWLKELEYPDSLGFLWEKLSKFLGFSEYDACKVMGLARYGSPTALEKEFQSFVHVNNGFTLDPEILEFRLDDFSRLERSLGPRRHPNDALEERHANVAASLQDYTDRIVLALANDLYSLYSSDTLCFAGGVALNCSSNWSLKEKGPFRKLYIPSAPHDAGTAVGAALYTFWSRNHDVRRESQPVTNAYTGPDFGAEAILEAMGEEGLEGCRCNDVAGEVAELISQGKIVGWFQDRMEFGPRALGNRSLLADPRDPRMRETLNRKVKHREDFRPFSPSVLEEDCDDWFEMGRDSASYAYMLFACPAKKDKAPLISAVLHVDGTARLQLVSKKVNRKYHELISRFKEITGVPLVLNTSFNDSEPIVCSPRDAIATFKGTDIDVLVLGNHIIHRAAATHNMHPKMKPDFENTAVLEQADELVSTEVSDTARVYDLQKLSTILRGWVDSIDLEAQLFVLRAGVDQFEVHCDQPDLAETFRGLKAEYVVAVTCERLSETGAMAGTAVRCTSMEVLNVADNPPFTPKLRADVSANLLSRYRYLEFRDPRFQNVFRIRHKLMLQISNYLDSRGCISVETPILSAPSASGSKEFCVNSTREPELKYALPQSSQVYGQLLVMGGVEAYYQWARCFRDEDLRANRQPEFTQLHLEMAFVDRAKLMKIIEGMLADACETVGVPFEHPLPQISYEDAVRWYGSDKPDLRFNVEPELWPHLVTESPFGRDLNLISTLLPTGVVLTSEDLDELRHVASQLKFELLGFVHPDRKAKFAKPQLSYDDIALSLALEKEQKPNDIPVWLGRWKFVDNLRRTVYAHILEKKNLDDQQPKYAWIVDFPLFTADPENNARLASQNHPFTAPANVEELMQCKKQKDLLKLNSQAFDLVVNGEEIGSGSILIHQYDIQRQVLNILGFSRQTVRQRFGYVLEALRFGAPPMGGFGLGFDRFVAAVCGENKIRNVIAFPKTKQGYCPVTRGA